MLDPETELLGKPNHSKKIKRRIKQKPTSTPTNAQTHGKK